MYGRDNKKIMLTLGSILQKATALYQQNLWSKPEVLNYLIQNRGLTESIIFRYKLGYSDNNVFGNYARDNGILELCVRHGVVYQDGNDYFNGYITLPIFKSHSIINIAGRTFVENLIVHKTLPNIPKTTIYNYQALSQKGIIIVESPIDALTLIQHGFNACAVMGVKISAENLEQFKDKVCYIIFDNDQAGQNGANTLAGRLFKVCKKVHIIKIPSTSVSKLDINKYFLIVPNAADRIKFLVKNSCPLKAHEFTFLEKNKKNTVWPGDQTDIVKVGKKLFDNYIEKGSNEIWVRCPHHGDGQENNRSLWIGGKKNIFTCFGCNISGGPVKLVSWHLGISEQEAQEWLSQYSFTHSYQFSQ